MDTDLDTLNIQGNLSVGFTHVCTQLSLSTMTHNTLNILIIFIWTVQRYSARLRADV